LEAGITYVGENCDDEKKMKKRIEIGVYDPTALTPAGGPGLRNPHSREQQSCTALLRRAATTCI
jgi:hypothetical protein